MQATQAIPLAHLTLRPTSSEHLDTSLKLLLCVSYVSAGSTCGKDSHIVSQYRCACMLLLLSS